MIREVVCDLLKAKVQVIAEVLNCQCRQRSGVALAIKNRYPEIEEADNKTIKGDRNKLGKICVADIGDHPHLFHVIGLYAQEFWGTERRQLDYEAMYNSLVELRRFCEKETYSIALPFKMGSDRAGGDWRIVRAMIDVVFEGYNGEVLICKLP